NRRSSRRCRRSQLQSRSVAAPRSRSDATRHGIVSARSGISHVFPDAVYTRRVTGSATLLRRATVHPVLSDRRQVHPVLVGLALVIPSVAWISLDRSIWPWDPSWYGQVSVDLWATLRASPRVWPEAMTHAFGLKPPTIAWLGQFFVPFGRAVGGTEVALLLS